MRRFPGFEKCLAMMKKHSPQEQEEGFNSLEPHAGEAVSELIAAFRTETDHGLRCWLIELVGAARSPKAFDFLAEQLASDEEAFRDWAIRGLRSLNSNDARRTLWNAGVRDV